MEDNLEIYFCEICSESIPAADLDTGDATKVKGKVIGPCCLADVRGPVASGAGGGGGSSMGLTALGAIVLVAIAAATLHLQYRFGEETDGYREQIEGIEAAVASSATERWATVEKRLDLTMQRGALDPVLQRIRDLESKLISGQDSVRSEVRGANARFAGVEESQTRLVDGQVRIGREIKDVETEILRLGRDVAAAAAAPRPRIGDASVDDASSTPLVEEPVKPDGLNKVLRHQVSRLKDADDGNRFEAVDQLVMSKNPAVLPHLLPMLKDSDVFVRRLTAEGLGNFNDKTAVSALIVSLADGESIVRHTAHVSLKKLSSQSIAFDPDGSAKARNQAQRRWKDWWAKAEATF